MIDRPIIRKEEESPMHLSVVSGPDAGAVLVVTPSTRLRVGRGVECELSLHDPSVSRLQFEVCFENGRPVLLDPDSRWGTLVNGVKATRHELQPRDLIRVGDTDLRWMPDSNPATSTIAPAFRATSVSDDAGRSLSPPLALPASGRSQALDDKAASPRPAFSRALDPAMLLGQTFASYQVQFVEARARTGIVLRAVDRDSRALVALKLFWPELMHDREAMGRFLRAIETMGPYRHPHLVTLYDAGVTEGLCWTASEFVIGQSVKPMIQSVGVAGMLDWQRVLRVAIDVARALAFATSQRIVHRNITPTNILVRRSDGVAKLGDLMLAKALDTLGLAAVTRAGEIVGDLPYLSPEQTAGERIDARSDLYSLGATLYALLTGRPPCEGLTTSETVLKIQTQRPDPPTKYHLAIPALFEGIVMRLLCKRPDDRFTDATQLLIELDRVEKYSQTVVARNAPPDAEPGVL
jgi:eukaryotic-like serine/threonine-protein kinase